MAEQADGVQIEAELSDAISRIMQEHGGAMVLKWVFLAESMESDGHRYLWTMTSEGVMAWDTVGMLQHGLHIQMAQTITGIDKAEED